MKFKVSDEEFDELKKRFENLEEENGKNWFYMLELEEMKDALRYKKGCAERTKKELFDAIFHRKDR